MKHPVAVTALAALILSLTACGAGDPEAAKTAYEACARPGSKIQLLELDGNDVRIAVTGDNAKALSGASNLASDLLAGNTDDDSVSSLAVTVALVDAVNCLVDQTGYPGSSDDLRSGEKWDGWAYAEEEGAGSEFTATFTTK